MNSLKDAARAAGALLENLIDIPSQPSDFISMFPAALNREQINDNKLYEQTISSSIFRE